MAGVCRGIDIRTGTDDMAAVCAGGVAGVKDYADRLYGYDPSDRLFEVTKHYLKHEMERGCKKTGLREIRVHDLRHSHASLLIELGFAPLLISERLGHESVTTTLEIYSHLYPTKHGEVADRLEAFA